MPVTPEIPKRFWSKVLKLTENECWEWQAAVYKNGYGKFGVGNKIKLAHRVAYELAFGNLDDSSLVCHSCDNRACCNPKHLFLGTCQSNTDDKCNKGRQSIGEKIGTSKLSNEQVLSIFSDTRKHREIAIDFGVARTTVTLIKLGKTWQHITKGVQSNGQERNCC